MATHILVAEAPNAPVAVFLGACAHRNIGFIIPYVINLLYASNYQLL